MKFKTKTFLNLVYEQYEVFELLIEFQSTKYSTLLILYERKKYDLLMFFDRTN